MEQKRKKIYKHNYDNSLNFKKEECKILKEKIKICLENNPSVTNSTLFFNLIYLLVDNCTN